MAKTNSTIVREKQIPAESEARFRDFAEASADWFWESDDELNLKWLSGGPQELSSYALSDLANTCHSHTSNEMLKVLQAHQKFADFVVHITDNRDKPLYMRISGKPVFTSDGKFVGYRGAGRDVSELVALNRHTEFLASHDELTGLPNRSLFRQRLEHSISKAERSGSQILLLFLDLDYFKTVNDTLGHEAGDELLVMATKRITELARASDILCRLGGDEFVMVMEGASPQDGHRLVRDIIGAFATPFEIKGQQVYCTICIGVSVYPDDTTDPQTLLVYADLAMYRAKQNGRNDFEFYTSGLNFIAHQWLEMEQGIRQALKEDQFFVLYQPQVENKKQQQLVGMEAILRWRHPERGQIPPMEFIKIAEQSTLINEIGEFVLSTVCIQIRKWLDGGYKVPRVSVNISARHLRSPNLSNVLSKLISTYAIPPALLGIEVTEHALLGFAEDVKKNMQYIKETGIYLSLDGFATGHSSFRHLKQWRVNEVKIDHSFVDGLEANEEDQAIIKAIVALGDALSFHLVGEGVENQKQVDILTACGCRVMQGYFFSQPIPSTELESWLKKK